MITINDIHSCQKGIYIFYIFFFKCIMTCRQTAAYRGTLLVFQRQLPAFIKQYYDEMRVCGIYEATSCADTGHVSNLNILQVRESNENRALPFTSDLIET